jgi:signal peptidase I
VENKEQKKGNWNSNWGELADFFSELLKIVLISFAIILPVRHFIVKPFYVKGASMYPTFENHDYLLIDEFSYRFNEPQRGDVIVFKYPRDPKEYYIKRIIGLPGDDVFIENGKVRVEKNGETVLETEDYLPKEFATGGSYEEKVPEKSYFVLGDNRSASRDSRVFGTVDEKLVTGRVWIRVLPFGDFRIWGFDDIPGLE